MALNVVNYSTVLTHDFRESDVKVSSISAPAAGDTARGSVTITLVLQAYEAGAIACGGSLILYYTQDGGNTLNACTISEAQTDLAVSAAGTSHSFTWDSVTDLGATNSFSNVQIAAVAYDGTSQDGDADKAFLSGAFTVDNTPITPTWVQTDSAFNKSFTKPFIFNISSSDPGTEVLWPYLQGDITTGFDSASLFTADSNDGSAHEQFDYEVDDYASTRPLTCYLVENVVVSGSTTVTYDCQVDRFTGDALPTTITDARVIIIQRNGRRVYQVSVSDTAVVLNESVAGQDDDGLCDLVILSDAATEFFVKSGVAVTSTTLTNVTFASLGNDDFGNDITDTFGAAPRIMIIDEVDRLSYLGTITTTGVELAKGSMGAVDDGQVTLFIIKDNSNIWQDDDVTVTDNTLTEKLYSALTDSGGGPPSTIQGSIVVPVPKSDRHVYCGTPRQDGVTLAQAIMGFADGSADINIFQTPTGDGTIFVPMLSTGIPNAYEGLRARWRPLGTEFSGKGTWKLRVAFGNEA